MPLDEWSSGDSISCAVPTACLSRVLQLFSCLPMSAALGPPTVPPERKLPSMSEVRKQRGKKSRRGIDVLHFLQRTSWWLTNLARRTHHVTAVTTATAGAPSSPPEALDSAPAPLAMLSEGSGNRKGDEIIMWTKYWFGALWKYKWLWRPSERVRLELLGYTTSQSFQILNCDRKTWENYRESIDCGEAWGEKAKRNSFS